MELFHLQIRHMSVQGGIFHASDEGIKILFIYP